MPAALRTVWVWLIVTAALCGAAKAPGAGCFMCAELAVDGCSCPPTTDGVALLQSGAVDYADGGWAALHSAAGGHVPLLPLFGEPVAVVYHLPSSDSSPAVAFGTKLLRRIFAGGVTSWRDREVAVSNPALELPAERFRVVVRDDACAESDALAVANFTAAAARVSGAAAMSEYLAATPYSIGYLALHDALALRLPYALVDGVAPTVRACFTGPGLSAAVHPHAAGVELVPDAASLCYPLMSIVYLAARTATPDGCRVMRRAWQRLRLPRREWNVPTTPGIVRFRDMLGYEVAAAFLPPVCSDSADDIDDPKYLLHVQVASLAPGPLTEAVLAVAQAASPTTVVRTRPHGDYPPSPGVAFSFPQATLRVLAADAPRGAASVRLPLCREVLVVAVHAAVSAGGPVVLDPAALRLLMDGSGSPLRWDDARLRAEGARYRPSGAVVRWGRVAEVGAHGAVRQRVGALLGDADPDATTQLQTVFPNEAALAAWVVATPGAAAVMSQRTAAARHLDVVHPRVDGAARPPSHAPTYPFHHTVDVAVPQDLGIAAPGACPHAAAWEAFVGALLHASDTLTGQGCAPVLGTRSLEDVACDGVPFVRPGGGGEGAWVGFVGAVSVIAAGGAVAAVVHFVARARRQRRLNALYGSEVFAQELSEAVAHVDVGEIAKKFETLPLGSLDHTQQALLQVTAVLAEVLRFVPPHVVRAARESQAPNSGSCPLAAPHALDSDPQLPVEPVHVTGFSQPMQRRRVGGGRVFHPAMAPPTDDLAARALAVLVLRPRADRAKASPPAPDDAIDTHAAFVELVLHSVCAERGAVHRVLEDSVVAVWGAPPGPAFSSTALSHVLRVALPSNRTSEDATPLGVNSGAAAGRGVCAIIGTSSFRAHYILGDVYFEAALLASAAASTGAPCLVGTPVVQDLAACPEDIERVSFFSLRTVGWTHGERHISTTALLGMQQRSSPTRAGDELLYTIACDTPTTGAEESQAAALLGTLLRALADAVITSCIAPLQEAVQLADAAGLAPPRHLRALFQWLRRAVPSLNAQAPLPPLVVTACGGVVVDGLLSCALGESATHATPQASSSEAVTYHVDADAVLGPLPGTSRVFSESPRASHAPDTSSSVIQPLSVDDVEP